MEQSKLLHGHPIFSSYNSLNVPLELSLNNLPNFKISRDNAGSGSAYGVGRRNIMVFRDSDVILAVGNEIRIANLVDAKTVGLQRRSYKTLHTPNVDFEIRQIAVNPNGKLLAVAGAHQVAVVTLPRTGYSKLVTTKVDCRTVQIGQFNHATTSAAPVCKIEWHPWGRNSCTLLVMTIDGNLREYDVSVDPEEPRQTLSFMPDRLRASSSKGDGSTREVTSFCLGKGKADWGPLTVYALTKSGDIWAVCPYLPLNATIPSAYIHALEYFVRAKEQLATNPPQGATSDSPDGPSFSTLYAYQLKYAISLSKQIPQSSSTLFPSPSRSVTIEAPSTIKARPMRQGPFLLQPAPRELEQGEGGDATDLLYLSVESTSSLGGNVNGGRLGVIAIAYSDGKVDICLDVEKIEAMWDSTHLSTLESSVSGLPMVAVYETIDLGLLSTLADLGTSGPSWLGANGQTSKNIVDILQANHPVFVPDPLYDDTVYLYHAFGVHRLNIARWLQPLVNSLHGDTDADLGSFINKSLGSEVTSMMDTFSPQLRSSRPVVGVVLPSDVHLSYSLSAITSSFDIQTFELALRVDSSVETEMGEQPGLPRSSDLTSSVSPSMMESLSREEASDRSLLSLLSKEPYQPPHAISAAATSSLRKLASHVPGSPRRESNITPETLRQLATSVHNFQSFIRDLYIALHGLQDRLMLQDREFQRQQGKYMEISARTERLKGQEQERLQQRFDRATVEQKRLLEKSDRLLQKLMDTSSPILNEHEKRWFAELKRMEAEVVGEVKYDSTSLKARTDTLTRKLEHYLPSLHDLTKREEHRRQEAARNPIVLGRGQELKIMMRLGEHKKMLSDVTQKIEQLASNINITLESLPATND